MEKDLILQVLLPCKFAVYANDVVSRAQVQAGLPQTQLLTPVTSDFDPLKDTERAEGLFIWRIGKELMWQQLDRGVDEWVLTFLAPITPFESSAGYSRCCTRFAG
jgi:hypothetical protein